MKKNYLAHLIIVFFLVCLGTTKAQDIALFQQFNGSYDFTAIGNTLNKAENGINVPCEIYTSSSATLDLSADQTIVAAYLYWAGSGNGDFQVKLNQNDITAERTFLNTINGKNYFAAFKNVTSLVQDIGNATYTLSDLDLTDVIPEFCTNSTNFGGWSIVIIYHSPTLPFNQVNVYDGLQNVHAGNSTLTFALTNLNIVDTQGAKIGFLAWEGDSQISVNETLRVNGNIISNPPLNPANNAFNSTNSYTGSAELWNMDMDFYMVEEYINIGDTSATITLTSGQDVVFVNNIVTTLQNQLPDAAVTIEDVDIGGECGNRDIDVHYTVTNFNSTDVLPSGTPIAFYANDLLVGTDQTETEIPIDGTEEKITTISIPSQIPLQFTLTVAVDDIGNGSGIVTELDEDNNTDSWEVTLLGDPDISELINLETCDVLGDEVFNLLDATVNIDPSYEINFFLSEEEAQNNINPIVVPEQFINTENPQTIYVRVANIGCFVVGSFTVKVLECPLPDAAIAIVNDLNACRQRELAVVYEVYNTSQAMAPLSANTPIAFYMDGQLVATAATQQSIPVGGVITQWIDILLPEATPETFVLMASVDDIGDGTGIVDEYDETNNTFETFVTFGSLPEIPPLDNLTQCNQGMGQAYFNLTLHNEVILEVVNAEITYYTSYDDALEKNNAIFDPTQYQNTESPQIIYIRVENEICFRIESFLIQVTNCPIWIPDGFSPNEDGINDTFEISNLLDIYTDFELHIYSRQGNLIFVGNNDTGFWDGSANTGLIYEGAVPAGLYYYVLNLNDPDHDLYIGWVYLNK